MQDLVPYLWVAFFIALVAALFETPFGKGLLGELVVKLVLGKTCEESGREKYVINNYLIQLDNGKTSQMDHILINNKGVFVVETKNYSGRIYGDDYGREWTQVLNYGKVKNKFYSPVKQNAAHVHHIKQLIPAEIPVYSAVVFIQGNTRYISSQYVYTLLGLRDFIKHDRIPCMSPQQVREIYNILVSHNKSAIIGNAEHVRNIQNTQNEIANNICPRCGGRLVARRGKRNNFLGCSNYPKCKFTKNF